MDKVKTKSPDLIAEMLYTIHYLLDFDEACVIEIYKQIPNLVKKITSELEFDGDRLLQSPVNRPILKIIGNLMTIPSL